MPHQESGPSEAAHLRLIEHKVMELHQIQPATTSSSRAAEAPQRDEPSSLKGAAPEIPNASPPNVKKTWRFWMAFVTLCISSFLSSVDATILATALPPIAEELHGSSILAFWCATSFLLAQTVVQPGTSVSRKS